MNFSYMNLRKEIRFSDRKTEAIIEMGNIFMFVCALFRFGVILLYIGA